MFVLLSFGMHILISPFAGLIVSNLGPNDTRRIEQA
jgi:hypothetical protein